MSTPAAASTPGSTYTDVKTIVLNAINDDNRLIGKAFGFIESKVGVKRVYILSGKNLYDSIQPRSRFYHFLSVSRILGILGPLLGRRIRCSISQ